MNPRERLSPRLVREGTVRDVDAGCTSIEVSVPCSTCRLGCVSRRGERRLELKSGVNVAELVPGEPVNISVDASGLAKSSAMLFGPVLLWAFGTALLQDAATGSGGLVVAAGLMMSLLLGRRLVRDDRPLAANLLDVRAERGRVPPAAGR